MKSKFVSGAIIVVALIVTLTLVAVATPQAIEPIDFDGATNPPIDIVVPSEPTDGIGNTVVTVPSNPSAENTHPTNDNRFDEVVPPTVECVPSLTNPATDAFVSNQESENEKKGSVNMLPEKTVIEDVVQPETPNEPTIATPDEPTVGEEVATPDEPNIATPDEPTVGEEVATPDEPETIVFENWQVCHIISADDITLENGTSCVLFLHADNKYHNLIVENDEWYFCGTPQTESNEYYLREIKPVSLGSWELPLGTYYVLFNNGAISTISTIELMVV